MGSMKHFPCTFSFVRDFIFRFSSYRSRVCKSIILMHAICQQGQSNEMIMYALRIFFAVPQFIFIFAAGEKISQKPHDDSKARLKCIF